MNITSALDGKRVCNVLLAELNQLNYNPDLRKMLSNIENMITELSKKEVIARQRHDPSIVNSLLTDINNAVSHLEKFILVAKLVN